MVFTFSDPSEQHDKFLNKLFGDKIMKTLSISSHVKCLKMNSPTEAQRDKILKSIMDREGIFSGKIDLEHIKTKAQKDLRSGIQLL